MAKYLRKFETSAAYTAAESTLDKPNVSYIVETNGVAFKPYVPPFFCKLTLNDDSTVELEGSGGLTKAMVSDQYKSTLVSAEIGELCTSIGDYVFQACTGLTSVTIPNSVTSIGSSAFSTCNGLTRLNSDVDGLFNIPNSVTSIGSQAFQACTGLTSIDIPNSVTSIGNLAFYGCTSLTSVTIPNSVTRIGDRVFDFCKGLTSVTIPNSVTRIGEKAFYDCTSLTSVTSLSITPPTLDSTYDEDDDTYYYENFWGNAGGRKIYVPSASVDTYKAASGWSDYASAIEAIPSV